MTAPAKTLLSIVELGGYPDFLAIYERAGFKVETINSVRKAITALRTMKPDVIVAEFNYQSDFRDRTSSLESLLATMQRLPDTKLIVFYEKEFEHQLPRVTSRFVLHATLPFPIDEAKLEEAVRRAAAG
jgi:DNA-binding NarL/FixJ family response regulator